MTPEGCINLSYVIPCYNHESFVQLCLDSVKNDMIFDSEIIIIDDGSVDQSVKMISDWIANNPEIQIKFIQQKNKGVSTTLNRLFDLARGEYIRVIASDDLLIAGSSQNLLNKLQANSKKKMIFGDCQTIDMNGKIISDSHIKYRGQSVKKYTEKTAEAIIANWAVAGPGYICKKEIHTEFGRYDESLLIEDWNMYLRLAAHNCIMFLPEPVAKYRIHTTNTSITKDIKKRITNLESQYLGGYKNLNFFKFKYQLLLKSELSLLKSKIYFLKTEYTKAVLYVAAFIIQKTSAVLLLNFKNEEFGE